MKRRHAMPFGAEVLAGGGVRFRLWAPGAARVDLHLEGSDPPDVPMAAEGDGWYGLTVAAAGPGSRYRYRIDGDLLVPDPASRRNPDDVHGPSEVIDPAAFDWQDADWPCRPWEEAVIYELHVGSFSPAGTFAGVEDRLDYLADLGITAIELMPVADFPGRRNWGYDGVLLFAPDASYGRPEDMKRLVQAAHARGLMVLLDVVYNHFGPEGNYLHAYAPRFFNPHHETPWGAAINFDAPGRDTVRRFFIDNALYWLEEYHLDGLRLDAIHAIRDDSSPDIVEELTATVRRTIERPVHLILENDDNQAHYLARDEKSRRWRYATAQWNDDIHHAIHVLATGETDGYYADYAADPVGKLGRCLAEGFAFQGDPSPFRDNALRGEPSAHLPPGAFIQFLQTHDQVGNRAFGERICQQAPPDALEALTAIVLLAPQPPMLFMGEEFAAATPFLFFCDFGPELAAAVTAGRRREFGRFARFADPAVRERIPDPNDEATFRQSCLDWNSLTQAPHSRWHAFYCELLSLRRHSIVPRLPGTAGGSATWRRQPPHGLEVHWRLGDGSRLALQANLGPAALHGIAQLPGQILHLCRISAEQLAAGTLPPWSVAWQLEPGPAS